MKKVFLGVLLAIFASSCVGFAQTFEIKGNGKEAHGAFDISLNYRSLSVAKGIHLVLVNSDRGEGFISADEEVLGHVSITEENGRVKVTYTPHNIIVKSKIKTIVTMPISKALSHLEVSSAASVENKEAIVCQELEVDGSSAAQLDLNIEARELDVELSSAAKARITAEVDELSLEANSAAKCEMTGSADRLELDINSAANFNGFELLGRSVEVDASSAARAEVNVTDVLSVDVSSGASVYYKGRPARIHQDVSSGGSLRSVE